MSRHTSQDSAIPAFHLLRKMVHFQRTRARLELRYQTASRRPTRQPGKIGGFFFTLHENAQ
jgi:hypothetical protein